MSWKEACLLGWVDDMSIIEKVLKKGTKVGWRVGGFETTSPLPVSVVWLDSRQYVECVVAV